MQYVVKYNKSTVVHKYKKVEKMTEIKNLTTSCTIQSNKKNQKADENKFEVTIIEAINESLSTFENLDKQKFYSNLKHAFKISKQEIPWKIEDFTTALEKIFGIGAKLIEIRIIEAIHKRIPEFIFTPKKGVIIFNEYVDSLCAFLIESHLSEAFVLA